MSVKPMWKEGLFMLPQHMQLLDSHHETLLNRRMMTLHRHAWGVAEVVIQSDELSRGNITVTRCTAVMPDGILVEVGPQCPIETLTIDLPAELANGSAIALFLGLPAKGSMGISTGTEGRGARYASVVTEHADMYRSAADAEIECVYPNVQLLLESDDRQNFCSLKIAEITLDTSGRFVTSDRYVPPSLNIGTSEALKGRLSRLVSILAAKQKELVAKHGGRGMAMVEFGAADVTTFWYVHTINSVLPKLMHYMADSSVHPETLYLTLASFCGQLASFEATTDPLQLPRFDFLDLAGSLFPLFERVFGLLGTVVSSRYQSIALNQTQPGLFVGHVDDPDILRRNVLYLTAGGDLPEETLRDDVPRYLKIGSAEQIVNIVQSALPGVSVKIDLAPHNALPIRAHMVYMRLDKQGHHWDAIMQAASIAIYQPVKPDRVKLELLAVEP